jgi:hypothetical protein
VTCTFFMNDKKVWGVDPGLNGGLSLISGSGRCQLCMDLGDAVVETVKKHTPHSDSAILVIEKIRSSPQMGVTSAFTFGMGYGTVLGVFTALGIRIFEVLPQVWKREMGLIGGVSNKSASIEMAKRLFPESHPFLTLKKHDGRAESLLLCHYGLRFIEKKGNNADEVEDLNWKIEDLF